LANGYNCGPPAPMG